MRLLGPCGQKFETFEFVGEKFLKESSVLHFNMIPRNVNIIIC